MKFKTPEWFGAILVSLATIGLGLAACSTSKQTGGTANVSTSDRNNASKGPTGVQLWSQNCGHCHNVRSPDSYSATQWEVAMLHMRIRANLTAQEHKTILEFLQSANRGAATKGSIASSPSKTGNPQIGSIELPSEQSPGAAVGTPGRSSVRAEQP
jgi:hypothetical protein